MTLRYLPLILTLAACKPGEDTSVEDSDPGDTDEPIAPSFCEENGLAETAWDGVGPFGVHRHDLADDFLAVHLDGSQWTFSENWTGCETYVFIPDTLTVSQTDDTSLWEADLDALVEASPPNVHFFFVSLERDEDAEANLAAMQEQVDEVLGDLDDDDALWWGERLHVTENVSNWVDELLDGVGEEGFAIDRAQRIRGVGSFADVDRYTGASGWPWDANLAYAAKEVEYLNQEAERQARMEAVPATIVPMWTGEVISQYADMAVELPTAAEMATFDTFEVVIDMRCPDPEAIEFGNCGDWDYLANFYVQDGEAWIELGRMITTYHREARWVVDVTPMMAHLLEGGNRTFRWSWAPYWNDQPTETRLELRFSNQGKGYAPRRATYLYSGGIFGSAYNDGRVPVEVDVASTAKKVELWALITGHGAEAHDCAEFCNHQHEFTVGSAVYLEEYEEAGTSDGCSTAGMAEQMTPNQGGTWWFGRGGWCPGMPVLPFAVDVTGDVTAGAGTTVSYRGLYGGKTPDDGSGNIVLSSWLVEYE